MIEQRRILMASDKYLHSLTRELRDAVSGFSCVSSPDSRRTGALKDAILRFVSDMDRVSSTSRTGMTSPVLLESSTTTGQLRRRVVRDKNFPTYSEGLLDDVLVCSRYDMSQDISTSTMVAPFFGTHALRRKRRTSGACASVPRDGRLCTSYHAIIPSPIFSTEAMRCLTLRAESGEPQHNDVHNPPKAAESAQRRKRQRK
jgi:hypothetical protein